MCVCCVSLKKYCWCATFLKTFHYEKINLFCERMCVCVCVCVCIHVFVYFDSFELIFSNKKNMLEGLRQSRRSLSSTFATGVFFIKKIGKKATIFSRCFVNACCVRVRCVCACVCAIHYATHPRFVCVYVYVYVYVYVCVCMCVCICVCLCICAIHDT